MEAGGRGKKRTNTYTKCFFVAVYFMSGSVRAFIKPQREITLARSESNEESLYVSGGFYLHSLSVRGIFTFQWRLKRTLKKPQ